MKTRSYRAKLQAWKKQMNAIGWNYCSGYDCKNKTLDCFRLCEVCRSRILKSTRKRTSTGKMAEYWAKPENRPRFLRTAIETQKNQKLKDPVLYGLKTKAYSRVYRALKTGIIERKPCEECGSKTGIQAHHYLGYAEEHQLDIQWLCAKCHARVEGRTYA